MLNCKVFFNFVAVNHENDTYLENGLVMGYADCKYYAGLVEPSKGPLSDTLQAGTCIFPPFQKSLDHTCSIPPVPTYLRVNMGYALAIIFQVRSLYVPT